MKKFTLAVLLCAALFMSCAAFADDGEDGIELPIVMYHHISKNPDKWNDYVLPFEQFEADMDYLKENGWQSISVEQLLAWYEGEFDMPEKPFMLTFDDGFESIEAYAEPIIKEHGYTGVMAVIGSVCEKFSLCNEHDPELSNMSWEDVRAMAERGVLEIQCHTWDMHSIGARRGCDKMRSESTQGYRNNLSRDLSRYLTACRENSVETRLTIAYPYGAYSEETVEITKDMGFLAAFTCQDKINVLTGDREELYHLCRYNRPYGVSSEKFFKKWEENS